MPVRVRPRAPQTRPVASASFRPFSFPLWEVALTSAQTCAEVCRNPGVCGGTNGGTFWESGGTLGFVPHATSYPAAPALRMPAAAPIHPLAGPTHGNSASSGTHATSAHYKQRTRAPQPRTWQHAWSSPCSSRPRGAAEHQLPATQVFDSGKGCILRHSHTSSRAAHQRQILRGMTIFTGDTGDKL